MSNFMGDPPTGYPLELIPGVHPREELVGTPGDDAKFVTRWIPTLEDHGGAIIWTGLPCASKSDAQLVVLSELGQRRRDGA